MVAPDTKSTMGDAAADLSQMFQGRTIPLLPKGAIPENDPLTRQIIASLVESLLPEPHHAREICCLTLPKLRSNLCGSQGAIGQFTSNPDFEFFIRLVCLRGYSPLILSSSMAVVLAELIEDAFTRISLTFGTTNREMAPHITVSKSLDVSSRVAEIESMRSLRNGIRTTLSSQPARAIVQQPHKR